MTALRRRARCSGAALGALVLAACGLALSACGIPAEATAHAVASTPKVNAPLPASATRVKPTRAGTVPLTAFFISQSTYLVPEIRYVKPPASVTTAIQTLLAGPTTHELYNTGITTALGPSIKLLHTNRVGSVVTVDFSTSFGSLSGTQEVLGVAQVVFTVTEVLPPTVGVLFEINGQTIPVPVASGGLVSTPVHQGDYAALRLQTSAATTTTTSS